MRADANTTATTLLLLCTATAEGLKQAERAQATSLTICLRVFMFSWHVCPVIQRVSDGLSQGRSRSSEGCSILCRWAPHHRWAPLRWRSVAVHGPHSIRNHSLLPLPPGPLSRSPPSPPSPKAYWFIFLASKLSRVAYIYTSVPYNVRMELTAPITPVREAT